MWGEFVAQPTSPPGLLPLSSRSCGRSSTPRTRGEAWKDWTGSGLGLERSLSVVPVFGFREGVCGILGEGSLFELTRQVVIWEGPREAIIVGTGSGAGSCSVEREAVVNLNT